MNDFIQLKKANCKNCYKCIRNCPVKSIRFSNNQANIIPDECVLCGMCFVACPQNAKQIRNDVGVVKRAIAGGRRVIASVAPSFIADFPVSGIEDMEIVLKKLGFESAWETAEGATIVKKEYERMAAAGEQDVVITSCCHTVNSLIEKYFPRALGSLADVLSPMQAHCKLIKQRFPDAFTVFVGPCISKKEEAELYGLPDVVLTFDELREWMSEAGVEPVPVKSEEEPGKRGRFFPVTGGILRSMHTENTGYTYLTVDGMDSCIQALREVESGGLHRCFIEMSACTGSCVGGPCMSSQRQSRLNSEVRVKAYAGDGEFSVSLPQRPAKTMSDRSPRFQQPGEAALRAILAQMGKTKPEDELNCGSCGYNTCREKAVAVYQGKADLNMCLPFLKEKAESLSDKIISNTPNAIFVLNEELNIQQMNQAACALFGLAPQQAQNMPVVQLLDPADYVAAVQTGQSAGEKRRYLPRFGKYVAETVIYDREYHLIMSIMRDITEQENENMKKDEMRRQTVETADRVIEKQMRVVQEIASLLGETTAETQIALTKLKQTLQK